MSQFWPPVEDETDPLTPLFWETARYFATQGVHLGPPQVDLPPASIGVQILEIKRELAINTPTQVMEVITRGNAGPDAAVAG